MGSHKATSFGDIPSFVEYEDLPPSRLKLKEILDDPPKKRKLQVELAITVDVGEPFVKAHYSCQSGYNNWIRGYSMAFLKKYASWCELCSPSELGIEEIVTEDMYVQYIFPHFRLMSESERYEHLQHIRDDLFYSNKNNLSHRNATVKQRAVSFINALQRLECIGEDGHPLHPVSHFCDHEKEIFTTFSRHFKYFISNPQETYHWMKFFRALL